LKDDNRLNETITYKDLINFARGYDLECGMYQENDLEGCSFIKKLLEKKFGNEFSDFLNDERRKIKEYLLVE
jgi:hypothetical protein